MQSLKPRGRKSISYAKYGYFFILPFFITYAFFMLYPLINTVMLSFKGNGDNADLAVGFENYRYLLVGETDPNVKISAAVSVHRDFVQAFKNTVILWFGNFIPQIILSLLLAVWFTDSKVKIKGTGFFKVVMYMPNIITATSVCALFLILFANNEYGMVNGILKDMGAWPISSVTGNPEPIDFINNVNASRIIVMFIQTWMWFGNTMILLMSGIMGIDLSLFEAASIDGASSGQVFFRITLPLLKPIFIYVLITSMIGGLQMFDIPFLFRNGNVTKDHLRTVAVFIYEKFKLANPNYGYSAAASVILFIITGVLGVFIYRFNTTGEDRAAAKRDRKKSKNSKLLGGL